MLIITPEQVQRRIRVLIRRMTCGKRIFVGQRGLLRAVMMPVENTHLWRSPCMPPTPARIKHLMLKIRNLEQRGQPKKARRPTARTESPILLNNNTSN